MQIADKGGVATVSSRGWFSQLSQNQRRTFWASFGGFGLDGMEYLAYTASSFPHLFRSGRWVAATRV